MIELNYIIEYIGNEETLKNILCILVISWIIISIIKKNMDKDGIHRYNFIQRNTIMYWILIISSLYLAKLILIIIYIQ